MAIPIEHAGLDTDGAGYEYSALSGPREIRILRLFKSKNARGPLCGQLFERGLDKKWPIYQAVSYTWGGQKPDRTILIDGKPLAITKNCEDFLLNFRDPKEVPTSLMFWVDSICINQKDDSEKSTQVQMMSEIYTRCVEVLVWLGPATKESDECFQLIRKSHKIESKFGQQFNLAERAECAEWKMLLTFSAVTGYCDSILTLCRKNTFFRTKTGLVGAAPMSVRNGDMIVLAPGLSSPLVVRPTGDHHRLVAPAYVHGMMKSEQMKTLEAVSKAKGDTDALNMDMDLVLI